MAMKWWASSAAKSLRVSSSSRTYLSSSFSLFRCFSTSMSLLLILDGLKYASTHEWVKHDGSVATTGITHHAQDHLGEVVFMEVPEPGGKLSKGRSFGAVESVKEMSDINSLVSGDIVEVNSKLSDSPGLINSSPFEEGWMIKVKPSNPSELESLMDATAYAKFCEEENAAH